MKLLSTAEAAARLGVTIRRVQALISEGRLPAQRVGSRFIIREQDLGRYRPQPTGRPRKPTSEAPSFQSCATPP